MVKKIKTVGKAGVIPAQRGLAACRPLHFLGAINGAVLTQKFIRSRNLFAGEDYD
jgi:hypothetical protein